jgi:flap endonuclease-1
MGIKGLKQFLKKHAPKSLREVNLTSLKGCSLSIDSSILLYKYRYIYPGDNFHIIGFKNFINELNNYDITAIFVFEGKPPEAKQTVLNKRFDLKKKLNEKIEIITNQLEYLDDSNEPVEPPNEDLFNELQKLKKNNITITRQHSKEVMALLDNMGVEYIVPDGEAEEYCAFLQKNGITDYVLTEDTDSLTFGATKVLFGNKTSYLLADLEIVLEELKFTYEQFIDFCILCGCDYSCTIPKVGPVNAFKLIKNHNNIEYLVDSGKYIIPEEFNFIIARELFKNNNKFQLPVRASCKKITNKPLFI